MQTTMTNTMAFGFPGDHANGQPYRADPYVASAEVEFGQPAQSDGVTDGFKKAKPSTGTSFIGVFVGAHQHIKFELPSDDRSITVPAGTTVGVASKGSWYIKVKGLDAGASTALAIGDELEIVSGAWTKKTTSSSGTAVAVVTEIGDFESYLDGATTKYKVTALVRLY